jgi:hypothetical protein
MASDSELIDNLYNAFDPYRPLPANDPAYVDCRAVRGDGDIVVELGNRIRRSRQMTHQLYSGHRGAGKSTELLRLKADLEQRGCFVVYFAADEEDINSEDVQYSDILLACSRHLVEGLKAADPKPMLKWLKNCWGEVNDLLQSEISFDKLSLEVQLQQFAKLTANLKTQPTTRYKIREAINRHTTSLIEALNQFIGDGKKSLAQNCQLVVIADNLDRIALVPQDHGRTNHEEIFLDRCEQLKALDCHVIYTVPISLIYSEWANEVKENYGKPGLLPMVMVRNPDGTPCNDGLAAMKELVKQRVQLHTRQSLETQVFDSPETLERLCLMSGGHVRELMLLMQEAINRTDTLPLSRQAVQRAITEIRAVYQRTPKTDQWHLLAKVAKSKQIDNEEAYRDLLFKRCVLEYQYFDGAGEKQTWYDVHPLIKEIKQFQEALGKL